MEIAANGGEGGLLAKEICDVLGLKHVRDLKIHMSSKGPFTVTAEMYMDIDGSKQLPAILQKFELKPIVNLENTTVLGQEIETFSFKK